jgi:hypothetical protein
MRVPSEPRAPASIVPQADCRCQCRHRHQPCPVDCRADRHGTTVKGSPGPSRKGRIYPARQRDPADRPYRSFRGLLEHLATLPRNQVQFSGTQITVPMLTEPTSTQCEAFSLLGTAIPLTLT